MDCSLPGSPLHGIFQARILEWVAISSSRESSQPRDWTASLMSPALAGRFFTTSAIWEASFCLVATQKQPKWVLRWPMRHSMIQPHTSLTSYIFPLSSGPTWWQLSRLFVVPQTHWACAHFTCLLWLFPLDGILFTWVPSSYFIMSVFKCHVSWWPSLYKIKPPLLPPWKHTMFHLPCFFFFSLLYLKLVDIIYLFSLSSVIIS